MIRPTIYVSRVLNPPQFLFMEDLSLSKILQRCHCFYISAFRTPTGEVRTFKALSATHHIFILAEMSSKTLPWYISAFESQC